ncbi:sensor histidine kinase [Actinomadura sp. WMMB 499]|uniref:sensor histidine kinase n=1 Tax=Actinomadura sp. WMMB 499 TaxID=1219491 RepID=UPI0012443D0B|nr:sensor histidine kinase [Actinomadura sp. WMMB 499]QFG22752.1 sensor histidine kinase [Actinomadura sp. WMMB 499]
MSASPNASRPVPWVPPALYGVVLLGGTYYAAVGSEGTPPLRFAGFVAGLAVLAALEAAEHRRYPARTPGRTAAALLAARLVLFTLVTACDGAGVSKALYVLLPFLAYFAFGRRAAVLAGAACTGLLVAWFTVAVPGWYVTAEHISDLLMFGLGLVLAVSMAAVAVGERDGRVRLEHALGELSAYTARVAELSTAAERNRLAREIHDSLGHHLTAIAIQLEKAAAFRDLDGPAAERAVADARWSADRALEEIRHSVSALHAEAGPFSLPSALADLVRHVDGGRARVTLDVSGEQDGHDAGALTALYRVAQEGLTNACRHADAAHVSVSLAFGGSAARLVVADDGRGPSGADAGTGLGLRGMRERVRLLGGDLDVRGGPEGGTTLAVTLPRTPR